MIDRVTIRLPRDDELPELLARLGFESDDARALAAARPPDAAVEPLARELADRMGTWDWVGWQAREPWFYAWVFLAALPAVRAYHRERGIPDDVSWATLAHLGRAVAIDRRAHGRLEQFGWLTLHFRGALYELGRLQYNRRDDPLELGLHIPASGPLDPRACDESLARAPDFFERHFGVRPLRAVCRSWLLDPQLAEYLPADSNLVRFQRRFELDDVEHEDGDDDVLWFVFRRTTQPLEELPQRTTLERAVLAHIRAGRHWVGRTGWITFPP